MKLITAVVAAATIGTSLGGAVAAHTLPAGRGGHQSVPAGWASTQTQAIAQIFNKAESLGPIKPGQAMRIVVALNLRNLAAAQTYGRHMMTKGDPMYRHFLKPAQFTTMFGPTASQAASVANYLRRSGFMAVSVDQNNLLVHGTAPAATVERAFNATINNYALPNGSKIFANATPAYVPAALSGTVEAVLGLNGNPATLNMEYRPALPPVQLAPVAGGQSQPASADFCGTGAGVVVMNECLYIYSIEGWGWAAAYDGDGLPGATNTNIAIMAEGNVSSVISNLSYFEQQNGLAQVPVTVEYTGPPSIMVDQSGVGEFSLDTQTSTAIAGGVQNLLIYDTPTLYDNDIIAEFNKFVTDDLAVAGSASFTQCEYQNFLDGSLLAGDNILLEGALQGQSLFSSAGDNGSFCGEVVALGAPGGVPMQGWPASSTYDVAVGGTSLFINQNNGRYYADIGWTAGGGGFSYFDQGGFWQQGVVPPPINPPPEDPAGLFAPDAIQLPTYKGVPDVAMDADPYTGAVIYANGTATEVGGTSLSSPLALGAWARVQSLHGNHLGFAPPVLYGYYKDVVGSGVPPVPPLGSLDGQIGPFHDEICCANGYFVDAPGWDFNTGLGSPDINWLNTYATNY